MKSAHSWACDKRQDPSTGEGGTDEIGTAPHRGQARQSFARGRFLPLIISISFALFFSSTPLSCLSSPLFLLLSHFLSPSLPLILLPLTLPLQCAPLSIALPLSFTSPSLPPLTPSFAKPQRPLKPSSLSSAHHIHSKSFHTPSPTYTYTYTSTCTYTRTRKARKKLSEHSRNERKSRRRKGALV